MTQKEKDRIKIASDTQKFLSEGGEIERYDSDDQPDFRTVGFMNDSSEVYS